MRTAPRLCEVYPGVCFTTEEIARKTSVGVAGECQLARWKRNIQNRAVSRKLITYPPVPSIRIIHPAASVWPIIYPTVSPATINHPAVSVWPIIHPTVSPPTFNQPNVSVWPIIYPTVSVVTIIHPALSLWPIIHPNVSVMTIQLSWYGRLFIQLSL